MCSYSIFNKINGELCYDLMGELTHMDDKIIWSYDVDKNIDMVDSEGISEEDVEIISIEEKLQEAYYNDLSIIQNNISLLYNRDDWYFTEPILNHTTIIFEFFMWD